MSLRNLSTYRKKRDFEKTAEPSGDAPIRPSKQRRFVIQKHAATRLHYDLRLEFDGVFKSWAVAKGPSLDPHDKRLAVEVEDHPLDYGDFEGTIPKGQYGGGTVQLWDRGYWESDDPEKGFAKGDLKFTLLGHKLHGSWVLVRMRHDRDGGKRTNWLLIKHRDEYAREGEANNVLEADRSVASGRSMDQIAAGKGKAPKPFMTARSRRGRADAVWHSNHGDVAEARAEDRKATARAAKVTRAVKVAGMPDFVAPELCTPVDRPPSGEDWCHEIKFDGYRVQLRVEDGEARLRTRKGLDWTDKFGSIAKEGSALPDVLIDGEIVALDQHGAPDFSTLQAAISDGKTDDLIFYAFDLLFAEGQDLRRLPLRERKARLMQLLEAARPTAKARSIRYVEHFEADGEAVMESARKLSLEGIVSKKLSAPYRSGRSESWTKAKCRAGQEVVLGGWKTTNGKFRSLMAGVHRGRHLAFVGMVGTGFGQDKVRRLHARAEGDGIGPKSVRRQGCAAQDPRRPLVEARARRRNRIRGLYRRRKHTAGRVQGIAPGQAGRRDHRGKAGHDQTSQNSEKARGQIRKDGAGQGLCYVGGEQVQRGDGRRHFKARQGAVAGRRRRQKCDQTRSRPLFRDCRRLDDRISEGTAVLDRPRT